VHLHDDKTRGVAGAVMRGDVAWQHS